MRRFRASWRQQLAAAGTALAALPAACMPVMPAAGAALLGAAVLAAGPALADESAARLPDCRHVLPPDLRRICQRGELRVARYSGERPPFFHRRDGGWEGFDVDLARDIAARLGVRYSADTSAASFDAVIDRVAEGQADLGVSKLSATLERAMRVRFSNPYLTVYQALLVNRVSAPHSEDPFRQLDAAGTTVGALAGSSYVGYAESIFSRAQVQAYDHFGEMMRNVVAGTLDAALMDSARANTWRRAHRGQLIQVRTTVDKQRKDPLALAVAWEDTQLLAWLNLYLAQIRVDGTANRLYRRWFVDPGGAAGARDGEE